jgi:hypothetical protein
VELLTRTALIVALATAAAHADPAGAADPNGSVVLAIDGKDIYVGLGGRDGVGAGSRLELLHEVVAKDPSTGATLHDHFALGVLAVAKSGDGVSVAHADDELAKRVLAGDQVRLVSPKQTFADPWAEQVAASKQPPAETGAPVDHAALVRDAWHDTLGKSPEQRIARWTALEQADPSTPYRKAIDGEIASQHAQAQLRDAAIAHARSGAAVDRNPRIARLVAMIDRAAPPIGGADGRARVPAVDASQAPLLVAPIERAVPGKPLELALVERQPTLHAWLFVRASGEAGFHRIEMVRDGDAYLRATIDGAAVHGQTLEWYAEIATVEGESRPALGSHDAPLSIAVDPDVREAPIYAGRSQASIHADYVDFQGKRGQGFDEYYQIDADFMYRFVEPVYAMRLGFGTLSGIGGPKAVINSAPTTCEDSSGAYQCKRVDFRYVYSELEFRLRPSVALMVRPQIGQLTTDAMEGSSAGRCRGADTAGCTLEIGAGLRGRLRFGEEKGTNLALAAGFSRGVGTLLEAAFQWLPAPVVPVQISVQVTDQPVIDDFGVRLIGDIGLRRLSWVYPSLRVSYQARDITHSGVSGGLGLNFDW